MARRKIGIDFDDVLMDTFVTFLAFCNARYGEQFQLQDFVSFECEAVWKITKQKYLERFLTFENSKAKRKIRPVAGSQEAIRVLAQIHDLHIITARPVQIAIGTRAMVERHFPNKFQDVHFCSTDNGATYHRPKHVVCDEIDANLHIDDNPQIAKACAEKGIKTLLFDRPWNQDVSHEMITRVHSWNEILRALCRL